MFHGHDHFDKNQEFTYGENKSFPIVWLGADNAEIYDPCVYFPTNQQMATGWYKFTSPAGSINVYFEIKSALSGCYRMMYNDIYYAHNQAVPISLYDSNGKQIGIIGVTKTEPQGVNITTISFTKGRTRDIDNNCNCYAISIDRSSKKIRIKA